MIKRFTGACYAFAVVDVGRVIDWITHIDLADWPQQERDRIKPAMACDPDWFGFKAETDSVVDELMQYFPNCIADTRMLSVVMSGDSIPEHVDKQSESWRCRVHVPLLTNPQSRFIVGGKDFCLIPGRAYKVNTEIPHAVTNDGPTNRIHFMFDVRLHA